MIKHQKLWFALSLAAASVQAQAAPITLTFDSLPSAQGWTYTTSPVSAVTEASVFSVANGLLVQNTLGKGDGRNYYVRSDGIDWTQPFSMRMRSRLTDDEGSSTRFGGPLGAFGFWVYTGTESYAAILRPGIIQNAAEVNIVTAFDTGAFHDYQLDITPGSGYRFSIDGVLVNTGAPFAISASPHLGLGDGTFYVSARAEVSFYELTQQSVPEPGTLLLAGLAMAAMLATSASGRRAVSLSIKNN